MQVQGGAKNDEWGHLQVAFEAYRNGDAAVVSGLFSDLGNRLHKFFFARTRNDSDSDDLTQAALLKIHLSRHSFNNDMSLKTWAFTVAQRTLIDHWRKRSRVDSNESLESEQSHLESVHDKSIIDLASQISMRRSLEDALQTLKPLDRSIVYLSVSEGLSMAELARVLESTEGAVKVRVHRLLKGLRKQLLDDDVENEAKG
ncbi:MAG: hypothetical protein RL189_1426 [Pseudomonadota bacterium]|jgi:RNA polymerase sigma-70 factor (ECF subfamily)